MLSRQLRRNVRRRGQQQEQAAYKDRWGTLTLSRVRRCSSCRKLWNRDIDSGCIIPGDDLRDSIRTGGSSSKAKELVFLHHTGRLQLVPSCSKKCSFSSSGTTTLRTSGARRHTKAGARVITRRVTLYFYQKRLPWYTVPHWDLRHVRFCRARPSLPRPPSRCIGQAGSLC